MQSLAITVVVKATHSLHAYVPEDVSSDYNMSVWKLTTFYLSPIATGPGRCESDVVWLPQYPHPQVTYFHISYCHTAISHTVIGIVRWEL